MELGDGEEDVNVNDVTESQKRKKRPHFRGRCNTSKSKHLRNIARLPRNTKPK